MHRGRFEEVKAEAGGALAAKFGVPVTLALVVDTPAPAEARDEPAKNHADEESEELASHLMDEAAPPVASVEDRLMEAFPGAEEVAP